VTASSLILDLSLGLLETVIILVVLIRTDKYSCFSLFYYYLWIISPFLLVFSLKAEKLLQEEADQEQPSKISFFLAVVLLTISPTIVELMCGALSSIIKFSVAKNLSIDDLYVINYTPALVSVIPLYLSKIERHMPITMIDSLYDPYNFTGIIINSIVLLVGGLGGSLISGQWLF
jgi:hypothetical protein